MLQKNLFISINDADEHDHGANIRYCLERALASVPHSVFHDNRLPQPTFSSTVEAILLSEGAVLDALPLHDSIDRDILIQFGICHALGKRSVFLFVKHNSAGLQSISSEILMNYQISFDHYLDVAVDLGPKIQEWLDAATPRHEVERNKVPVHAFSVFGADREKERDLHGIINDFATDPHWRPLPYNKL